MMSNLKGALRKTKQKSLYQAKKKTNIHEETYLDFCNFLNKKRLNDTKKRKDELLYTIDELPHYNDF